MAVPLQVAARPLDVVGVFINDPDAPPTITATHLAQAFGLTGAESRLLWALAEGKTIGAYAEEAALSLHTVRGTLKILFAKMDCHRQSDLVRKATALMRFAVEPRR